MIFLVEILWTVDSRKMKLDLHSGPRIRPSPNYVHRHCTMFSNVSAPVCQTWLVFFLDFNDSYLSPVALILHRCFLAMNSIVSHACRLGTAHNVYDFQLILALCFCFHVHCVNMLLLANVLVTCSECIEKCERQHSTNLCCQFYVIFPLILIDFMLSPLGAVLATSQNMQRICCDMKCSSPLMSTEPSCA